MWNIMVVTALIIGNGHALPIEATIATETGLLKSEIVVIDAIGHAYSIEGEVLTSLFMKETKCGRFMGKHQPQKTMSSEDWQAFTRICAAVGRNPAQETCSSAGAIGLTQFMPTMWEHYGVDFDGDGVANPWDLEDAIASSAVFLNDHGYQKTPWSAVCSYNGGKYRGQSVQEYTNKILRRAAKWGAKIDL